MIESIKCLNMHKSISIICELLRVRDSYMEPVRTIGAEFRIPFETILKRDMYDIVPKSAEEMYANPLLHSVRRRIEIGVNCIFNSRLLPSQLRSCTSDCTVREGKLQILVALFQREIFSF